jgi:hypothetical protein
MMVDWKIDNNAERSLRAVVLGRNYRRLAIMQGSHCDRWSRLSHGSPPFIITGLARTPEHDPVDDSGRYASRCLKTLHSPLFHRQVCLNIRMSGRGFSCPSQRAITVISTRACTRCRVMECRNTFGEIRRRLSSGYFLAAFSLANSSRSATLVRVKRPPVRVGNSSCSDPVAPLSCSHRLICLAVSSHRGTCHSLRPLPRMRKRGLSRARHPRLGGWSVQRLAFQCHKAWRTSRGRVDRSNCQE